MTQNNVVASRVVSRTPIDEAIVALTIPTRGEVRSLDLPDGIAHFYLFTYSVKGGSVEAHVRDDHPEQFPGHKIQARAVVLRKVRADGGKEIYIDLFPVAARPTHEMCVTNTTEIPRRFGGKKTRTHAVPAPRKGLVIFAAR